MLSLHRLYEFMIHMRHLINEKQVKIDPLCMCVLYTNIDQKLVDSLHGLLNCDIGGLDCCVITREYTTRVH